MGKTSFKLVLQITKLKIIICSPENPAKMGKVRKLPHKKTSSFSILHFTHCSIAFDNDIQQFMCFTKQPKDIFYSGVWAGIGVKPKRFCSKTSCRHIDL